MSIVYFALGTIGVLFVILQIYGIISAFAISSSEYTKIFQEEDKNGFITFKINNYFSDWIPFTIGSLILVLREKGSVKYIARQNTGIGKYDNRFKKESFQKLYDKVYLEKRKAIIKASVKSDMENNYNRTNFLNDAEKALYQNLYLTKLTGKENSLNLVKERAEKMYAEIQLEPVENEVFSKIISQSQ